MNTGEKGEDLYHEGYNCAEAVARVSKSEGLADLSEDSIRSASVFGGGMANRGEICGALVGGLIALGAKYGRTTNAEDNEALYQKASELMKDFEDKNGTIFCIRTRREIMKSEKEKALAKKLTCAQRVKIVLEKLEEMMKKYKK